MTHLPRFDAAGDPAAELAAEVFFLKRPIARLVVAVLAALHFQMDGAAAGWIALR